MRRLRTFVRHGPDVIELEEGRPLTVGRLESCDVMLDDDLASREHCRIELRGDEVTVEDLQSKNGVLVNGLQIRGRERVHHGDLVTVGRAQLVVARQAHAPRASSGSVPPRARRSTSSDERTGAGNIFEILGGAARASIDSGDLMEAERSALNLFMALRGAAARGRTVPAPLFDAAMEIGLDLAAGHGEASWLDKVLEGHAAFGRVMKPAVSARLQSLVEQHGCSSQAASAYVAAAREQGASASELAPLNAHAR